jgi:hypothetical protein
MLPKLEELRRDDSPISCIELSSVSKNLVSLRCMKGFDFDPAQVDMFSLKFPRLKMVEIESQNGSDFQFIVNVLENSFPQGQGLLQSLFLRHSRSAYPTTNSSVEYDHQLIPSLIKVIEVRLHTLTEKASPGMSVLQLIFNNMPENVNLDSCLDIFFKLDHITNLVLFWNQMSLEKVKSSLRKQGGKKRWEIVVLGRVDQELNDADILEICSYLPLLIYWSVLSPRSIITIDGAREWKRICPNLETVHFIGGGRLSEEVKEVLRGLGVIVTVR